MYWLTRRTFTKAVPALDFSTSCMRSKEYAAVYSFLALSSAPAHDQNMEVDPSRLIFNTICSLELRSN